MLQQTAEIDLIAQACGCLPDAAVWTTPVYTMEGGREVISDFELQFSNPACSDVIGRSAPELLGRRVQEHRLPDPGITELIFAQLLQVYQTGRPLEYNYYSESLDKYIRLIRSKVGNGVLTIARNVTEEQNARVEQDRQAKLLQSLIDNSPYGICLYESIRGEDGSINDFRLKIANKRSSELTELSMEQLYGNTVKELMLLRGHSSYFDTCRKVVETGEPVYLEYHSRARDQWLGFSIVKFDDGYLLNYIDVTATKHLEQQVARNAHELNAIFNGSLSGIYAAKAIQGDRGNVQDLVFLRANDAFLRIFEMKPEDIFGKSLLELSDGDNQQLFLAYVSEVLSTGNPAVHVLQYHKPERWFEFSIVQLETDIISVTINDITAQRQATSKIEEQKQLLDSILKYSPNGLAVTQAIRNEKGEMIDASTLLLNDACAGFNGIPNEVMLANSFAVLSPLLIDSPLFRAAAKLQSGESFRTEYALPNTGKWIELAVAKMDDERFKNVFTDITDIKQAQWKLEELVAELRRSNESLESFAYAASHDLKEPIRKIRLFAEQLQSIYGDAPGAAGKTTFERLDRATLRMKQLIDDLLAYAQVQQGTLEYEDVDLNDSVRQVLEDLDLAINESGATFTVGHLPALKGNKRQLQQLLQNLIANGIKYHKPGIAPDLSLSAVVTSAPADQHQATGRYHVLRVQDNGIGMQETDVSRIFDLFTRVHGRQYNGSGIGLSIVRKVVDNHKGFIKVHTSPGNGSCFEIYLPA
ncbi:MAG: PAS domain-containing protein [Chitinophagaceae bacterium]|nr:MAG: PAS domain-containing protein [Chitinophagaceae bacterium]